MIRQAYICSFLLHRKSEGEPPHLVCRVKWNASRAVVSVNVGFIIDPDKWDPSGQLCKPRTFHGKRRIPAAVINAEIGRYKAAVDKVFTGYAKGGVWPSVEAVRSDIRTELGIDVRRTATPLQVFDEFVRYESTENSWTLGTLKKMRTLRHHIDGSGRFADMEDFHEGNLVAFAGYLMEDKHLCSTSIYKYVNLLKWFLRWADRKHYLDCRDYAAFRPNLKMVARPVIYLTWAELMRVWEWEPTNDYLGRVRDMFCFSCFTSLRYSDVVGLRWADVTETYLSVVTVKTSDPLRIELNKWSRAILERADRSSEHVFPSIANQVMNRDLKTIARACGIDTPIVLTRYSGANRTDKTYHKYELITTHCGRRTFICQALMLSIPPDIVMKWTGHSDYQSMKPYIEIADDAKAKAMSLFDHK